MCPISQFCYFRALVSERANLLQHTVFDLAHVSVGFKEKKCVCSTLLIYPLLVRVAQSRAMIGLCSVHSELPLDEGSSDRKIQYHDYCHYYH